MKNFKNLVFKKHSAFPFLEKHAKTHFENGYGVSVVCGRYAYSNVHNPYEVGILKEGKLCYTTKITDDVIGNLDEQGVSRIMKQVQKL